MLKIGLLLKQRAKTDERLGEIYVFVSGLLFAGFPVLINYTSDKIPPTFFAAITDLIAGAILVVIMAARGQLKELAVRKAWPYLLMVAIFIIVIPRSLFYNGTRFTSAINTSILLEVEILFAMLYTTLIGEKMTRWKLLGGLAVFLGTILTLYNGHFVLNKGDLMIVAGTAFLPIGNIYAKKALKLVSPSAVILFRSLVGGLALLALSTWFDAGTDYGMGHLAIVRTFLWIILLNSVLITIIQKLAWYGGLKRLEVGKATIIVMSYPAFSMILASIFLREIPTLYQFGGLLIIFAGLFSITAHKSELPAHVE
ncbi:MAG: DMT family transporter [Candidatus Peregrinibacteria bacterium]